MSDGARIEDMMLGGMDGKEYGALHAAAAAAGYTMEGGESAN